MEKICRECNKKFDCLGTEKCWCYSIKITYERSKELKSCHDDCFCKECILSEQNKLKQL